MKSGNDDAPPSCDTATYRFLLDSVKDLVFLHEPMMIDAPKPFLFVNQAATDALGYSRDELLTLTPIDIFNTHGETALDDAFRDLADGHEPDIEEVLVGKDGQRIPVEMRLRITQYRGKPTVVCTAQNVTDRQRAEEALRSVEFERAGILDYQPDLVVLQEPGHRIVWPNRAAYESVGLSRQEMIGRFCHEFWGDGDGVCAKCPVAKALQTGEPEGEIIEHNDGRTWHIRACPLRNEQGEVVRVVEVAEDITQRLGDELEYARALQTTIDGFWIIDMQGGVVETNQAAADMLGYEMDELKGMSIGEIDALDSPDDIRLRLSQVAQCGNARFETRYRRKDGSLIDVDVSASYVSHGSNCFVIFTRDVTERKRHEERLRFQSMPLDQIQDKVTATDLEGRITYVNDAECRMFGKSAEELIGSHVEDYGDDSERGARQQEIIEATISQGKWRGEVVNFTGDGREAILDCRTHLLRDEAGEPVGMVGISTDITRRKAMEQALLESEERYRDIFDNAQVGIFRVRLSDGKLLLANRRLAELLGCESVDQALAAYTRVEDYAAPADWERLLALVTRDGRVDNFEGPVARVGGGMIWCRYSGRLDAERSYLEGVAVDITSQKEADAALRDREETFRALAENSPDVVMRFDREHRHLYASPAVEELTGLPRSAFIGKTHRELGFPEDLCVLWEEALNHVFAENTVHRVEFQLPSGVWIDWLLAPEHDRNGRVVAVITTSRDVSNLKRTQQALESRILALTRPLAEDTPVVFEDLFDLDEIQRLQDLFTDATGVAALLTRPDGTPVTKPSNFCRLCRDVIRPSEVGGRNCRRSDSEVSRQDIEGPVVRLCHSAGLWNAGTSITAGGRHIANWLVGQVRNEAQDEEEVMEYAREIGADIDVFREAFYEVPVMSREQFERVAQILYALAKQLSTTAYQNIQQARFIEEQKRAEEELKLNAERMEALLRLNQMTDAPLQDITDQALEQGVRLTRSAIGYLAFANEEESVLTMYSWSRTAMQECAIVDRPVEYPVETTGLWGEALRQRRPVITNDYDAPGPLKKGLPEGHVSIKRHMNVPIFSGGRIVAVAGVGNKETDYAEGDVQQLTLVMEAMWRLIESRRFENALRESEERYRSFIENLPVGVYQRTPGEDNQLLLVNPAFCRLFGCEPDKLLGTSLGDAYADSARNRLANEMLAMQGRLDAFELEARRKDGTQFMIRTWARVTGSDDDRRVEGVTIDVTDLKQAEAERERLMSAIEQAAEAIVITDAAGTIQYVNPAFESTTGYARAEAIGQNPRMLKSGEHDQAFYRKMWDTLNSGKTWEGRIVNRRKDGTLYTEDATIAPVFDGNGAIVNYVAVRRDISSEIVLEDQLRQAQKMEAVGQLTGGVAHDFNNLLQVINGHTEFALAAVPLDSEIRMDLEQVATAGKRAARLVSQLLAFSRRQVMKPEKLNMNAVVSDLLKMLGRVIGEDIRLEFLPGQRLGSVFADRGMLEQVLMNLCVNARDAMPGGGALTIETENVSLGDRDCRLYDVAKPGRHVMLGVTDTGCGIAEDDLDHVFEPFFTTKEVGKGTGLGLATVYGIVKQHEGAIRALSKPGAGTTFRIYLPIYERPTAEVVDDVDGPVAGGTETILLAEDDAMVRRLAGKMLERAGYTVLYACDGAEAVALFKQHADDVDLLIFDAVMPALGGWDAYEQIRATRPGIPAFFASGYSESTIHPSLLEKEQLRLVQKPFSHDVLLRAVRQSLDEHG